jgi:hypothetical protein
VIYRRALEDAGVIEVIGTAYSAKGREMRIYGPADSPLVIFAGETERISGVRSALSRLFGGFLALAVGALAIQELFGRSLLRSSDSAPPEPTPGSGDGDAGITGADGTPTETPVETDAPEGTPAPQPTETPQATETAVEAADTPVSTPEPTPMPTLDDSLEATEGLLATGIPPGLAFFLGGAAVLTVVVALTYLRAQP